MAKFAVVSLNKSYTTINETEQEAREAAEVLVRKMTEQARKVYNVYVMEIKSIAQLRPAPVDFTEVR